MSLTRTTTTAAITASQLTIPVTDTSQGFPAVGTVAANQPMYIDGELMFITGVPVAGMVTVRGRGTEGVASTHDILASVVTSSTPSDFPGLAAGQTIQRPLLSDDQVTLGQDATVSVPSKNTTYTITKATAAALTLAGGTPAQSGITMTFIAATAQAHVLTYTAGFNADTTASDVATFGSKIGASLVIQVSATGALVVLGTSNVTVA